MKINRFFKSTLLIFISFFIFNCSSDDNNSEQLNPPPFTTNGYTVNGNYHNTDFSLSSGQSGITEPFLLSFFSHEPPFDNLTVYYVVFQLQESNIVIGEHEIKAFPIEYAIESSDPDNPTIIVGDNTFISGKAIVYNAEFDNSDDLIFVEIAYFIDWQDVSIKGFYNGEVQ